MSEPWHDAPRCWSCETRTMTRRGECIAPGELRCACCGDDFPATPFETSQALAADAAWDAEEQRELDEAEREHARKVDAIADEHAARQLDLIGARS